MPITDLSDNNIPASAPPPPPPPLPLGDLKNWKPRQDNGNSNKPYGNSGTNNSTQSEKGLSENPIQLPTEQKSDTPILINTLVGISKTAALKYSIAILLLFTSGAVAGVCTYFMISAVSSGVAVPVLFAVIASVSALVMLSSAVYLINSHISAINSEKGVDPGRKQSQYSELQKEAESLGHSNTPTSSLPLMSRTTIVPPPPPPPSSTTVKPNDLSTAQRVIRKSSPSDTNQKDVQQKQSNASIDNRRDLLAEIIQPRTLKKVSDEQKNYLSKDGLKIPQKQEEESTPGKQENGVQPLNNGVYQIRKVESQKTDKEPSNSEGIQQGGSMDILAIAIQKQRGKSGFQDEQLYSLDENDHQEDSLFCLEEEQFKPASQEQKKCVQQPDAALSILKDKYIETIPSNSFFNSNSEECKQDWDDENWDTEPYSIPYIYPNKTKQEKMKDGYNHNCSASSPTKTNTVELASSEMQESSTVSVQKIRKRFNNKEMSRKAPYTFLPS